MELQTWIVLIIELIGTVAFSVSGAIGRKRKQMDIFGVVVLGVVTKRRWRNDAGCVPRTDTGSLY